MTGRWARAAAAGALAGIVLTGLTGCSDGDNPVSGVVSQAASAAESAAAGVTDAASKAADRAKQQLSEVKDGVEAKDEVTLGSPATDADGRTTVQVTARNTDDSAKSFTIQVVFKDSGGALVDTVVLTISDVAAGQSKDGTARSTHKLPDTVTASVATALRH
ncbi:FxLYD domain-containing protein [Streptomyces sp. NPDC048604]|uniref:FxLYD domain-containing protein n=1 Tax=Streptomyces sp. NPDC048604 TaxID=3365578 RepID=UPI003710C5BB